MNEKQKQQTREQKIEQLKAAIDDARGVGYHNTADIIAKELQAYQKGGVGAIVDECAVRELTLYAEKTSAIYVGIHRAFVDNYAKKIKKGIYNHELALKGIANSYVRLVKDSYMAEFGIKFRLSQASRTALAKNLLSWVLDDIKEQQQQQQEV
jgi:hypothetical protein